MVVVVVVTGGCRLGWGLIWELPELDRILWGFICRVGLGALALL